MPSRLFPYAFLLSLGFISTIAVPDIRYHQNLIPYLSSDERTLKALERLLKIKYENVPLPFPHLEDFGRKEEQLQAFERQTLQDVLSDNADVIHGLPKRRQKHVSNYPPLRVGDGLEENPILRGYAERNPREYYSYYPPYPKIGPLTEANPEHQDAEYPTIGYRSHHQAMQETGMKEDPRLDFGGKYFSPDQQNLQNRHYSGGSIDDREDIEEEFTYRFDEPIDREDTFRFAVKPNQPGYYNSEVPVSAKVGVDLEQDDRTERILPKDEEDTEPSFKKLATLSEPLQESSDNAEDGILPGLERRADNSPSVMAVDRKTGNDIYFVAVVAGCSAAAMFILVLISLTWCRLKRGAKAAADVEYPAYGVTGPNKDTSPSGDRRLAQSAQMYHYQHQKQQIIAMESRTATARDPGSVSEAESDEENEEGDYTVYECPGLAPTGEMEVKNPLFHDDPTPATPAGQGQKNRSSEDHM